MWRNKLSQMSKRPLPNAGIQKPQFNPELVAGGGKVKPGIPLPSFSPELVAGGGQVNQESPMASAYDSLLERQQDPKMAQMKALQSMMASKGGRGVGGMKGRIGGVR